MDNTVIKLADVVNAARARIGLITAVTAACAIIAAVIAFLSPKIYRAESVVLPVASESQGGVGRLLAQYGGGLAQIAGIGAGQSPAQQELLAVLQSRALKERMIERHNLLPLLFWQKWNGSAGKWRLDDNEKPPSVWAGTELLGSSVISVVNERQTGLVRITVEWTNPVVAATWANLFIQEANAMTQERAITEAQQSVAFLQRELKDTEIVGVQQSIYRLMENEIAQRMLANVRPDYGFRVIDKAVPPERKARPKKLQIITAGLLIGLLTGVASALVADLRRRSRLVPANV